MEVTPKYLPTIKYCLKSSQKKNRVIPVVTYCPYPQTSKMADNLRFTLHLLLNHQNLLVFFCVDSVSGHRVHLRSSMAFMELGVKHQLKKLHTSKFLEDLHGFALSFIVAVVFIVIYHLSVCQNP